MKVPLKINLQSPTNAPKKPCINRKLKQQTLFDMKIFKIENKQDKCKHKFIYGIEQGIDEHPERTCKKCGLII